MVQLCSPPFLLSLSYFLLFFPLLVLHFSISDITCLEYIWYLYHFGNLRILIGSHNFLSNTIDKDNTDLLLLQITHLILIITFLLLQMVFLFLLLSFFLYIRLLPLHPIPLSLFFLVLSSDWLIFHVQKIVFPHLYQLNNTLGLALLSFLKKEVHILPKYLQIVLWLSDILPLFQNIVHLNYNLEQNRQFDKVYVLLLLNKNLKISLYSIYGLVKKLSVLSFLPCYFLLFFETVMFLPLYKKIL